MRSSRPVAALVVVALGGAMLTGCTKSPATAATVDGTTITRTELADGKAGANQILGAGNELSDAQALTVLIQGVISDDVAKQRNIVITDSDRNAKLSSAALAVSSARPFVYAVADTNIVAQKIGETQLSALIKNADVVVNPRYGSWEPATSIAVLSDNGSLSQVLQSSNP